MVFLEVVGAGGDSLRGGEGESGGGVGRGEGQRESGTGGDDGQDLKAGSTMVVNLTQ